MATLRLGFFVIVLACAVALAATRSTGIEGGMCASGSACASVGMEAGFALTTSEIERLRAEIRAAMSTSAAAVERQKDATCSGGANGGMDATGNECNEWTYHDETT